MVLLWNRPRCMLMTVLCFSHHLQVGVYPASCWLQGCKPRPGVPRFLPSRLCEESLRTSDWGRRFHSAPVHPGFCKHSPVVSLSVQGTGVQFRIGKVHKSSCTLLIVCYGLYCRDLHFMSHVSQFIILFMYLLYMLVDAINSLPVFQVIGTLPCLALAFHVAHGKLLPWTQEVIGEVLPSNLYTESKIKNLKRFSGWQCPCHHRATLLWWRFCLDSLEGSWGGRLTL